MTKVCPTAASLLVWLAACGGGVVEPPPPPPPAVGSIGFPQDSLAVGVGASVRLTPIVRAAAGNNISNPVLGWSSSSVTVATVSNSGLVQAVGAGTATITATAGTVSGSVRVSVSFPSRDSVLVSTADSTIVQVGQGTSLTVSRGSLPVGSKIILETTSSTAPSDLGPRLGSGIRLSIKIPAQAAGVVQPLVSAGAHASLPRVLLRLTTSIEAPLNQLGDQAFVVVSKIDDAATKVVVRGDQLIDAGIQNGKRVVTAVVAVPINLARLAGNTFQAGFDLYTGRQVCNEEAWKLYRRQLSGRDVPPSASADKIPLVFVHGWQPFKLTCGSVSSYAPEEGSEAWSQLVPRILNDPELAQRYEVFIFTYPTFDQIEKAADHLQREIEQRFSERDVVIVAHSMGGLVAAKYMSQRTPNHVQELLAIGTPFGGSPLAAIAGDDFISTLAFISCTGGLGALADVLAGSPLLAGPGPQSLNPQSTFLGGLGQAAGQFSSRLRTYTGAIDWSRLPPLSQALPGNLVYLYGGCALRALGMPISDGVVPSGSTTALGAVTNATFGDLNHAELPKADGVDAAVLARLRILAQGIPTQAASILKYTGDLQVGPAKSPLGAPVEVRVLDRTGLAVSGALVSFVPSSGGSFVPSTVRTDNDGIAAGFWVLGGGTGAQQLQASVAAVPGTVLFVATATAPVVSTLPCQTTIPYVIGTTASGTIANTDCQFSAPPFGNSGYHRQFSATLPSQQAIAVSMTAPFSVYLGVSGANDAKYTPGLYSTGAALSGLTYKVIAPAGRVIVAPSGSAPSQLGAFTITTAATNEDAGNCQAVLLLSGIATAQRLESSDCSSGSFAVDRFQVSLPVGATIAVTMLSAEMDTYLRIRTSGGSELEADDDGAGGTNSLLRFTSSVNTSYVVEASSYAPGERGAYVLLVWISYANTGSIRSSPNVWLNDGATEGAAPLPH